MADNFRVCIQGHLDDRWSGWFEGLGIQRRNDGTTALVGHIGDQAALFGVLSRIRDLGLVLLSVNREDEPDLIPAGEVPSIESNDERKGDLS